MTGVGHNAPMVAIIRCTEDEADLLRRRGRYHDSDLDLPWTTTRPRKNWHKGSHLTLVVTADRDRAPRVHWLGWTTRVRQTDDLGEKLEVSRIRQVADPVLLDDLFRNLSERHRRYLVPDGQLPEGTGKRLVEVLLEHRPDLREAIAYAGAHADRYPVGNSPAAAVLALQRDATIGATRMAGMNVSGFAEWDPPPGRLADSEVPPPFIGTVPAPEEHGTAPALEDHLVNHDAETMVGWLSERTRHVSWRTFTRDGRRLLVANANRTNAELTLGVDLIYYNVAQRSLVMVQYKKLDAQRNGFYYPNGDESLVKELERMRSVDQQVEKLRSEHDDFRLAATPCWIKICHPQAFIPRTEEMIHGMYFSREHFEQLRTDPRLKGTREGSVRFGYQNVPSYLDNTMFSKLVETGLIGTTGTSTDVVHDQVLQSFDGQKAVVLAALSGEDEPQSKRNSRRRRS